MKPTDTASRERDALRVERVIVELRRGRPIEVRDETGATVVAALETLAASELSRFASDDGRLRVVITGERASALGISSPSSALELSVRAERNPRHLALLAGLEAGLEPAGVELHAVRDADARTSAALTLTRHGQLIPALIRADASTHVEDAERLWVSPRAIERYPAVRGREVQRVSRARVPLAAHEQCEFVVYRERFGDAEHVAIVIGNPERTSAPLVRLHSACLTGDLLGSLRCDCGDQLRDAVERIAASGGGIVLYLAHEGRGIGLANKLRAYALQDNGLDTLEADQHLGFRSDERDYAVAGAMLHDLGVPRIRLLTNNPGKIAALSSDGIEVVGREPLHGRETAHNARYLRTKRERAGHLGVGAEDLES
jgi:GTP cyclohydrolase II